MITLRDALHAAIGCLELEAMIYDARVNDPRLATDKRANKTTAADLRTKIAIFKSALDDPTNK